MFTVLWCYLRNPGFKKDGTDYHVAADLTGQANHLGVTIEADIIKQKLPEVNGGYNALNQNGSTLRQDQQAGLREADDATTRSTLTRYQVANCYLGRSPPDQLGRRVVAARATWPRPSRPRSSTSAPAAPA